MYISLEVEFVQLLCNGSLLLSLCLTADDYDDGSAWSTSKRGQLDDIRDWESGNKSIAEEAIDKVKEVVSKVKFFDNPEDYRFELFSYLPLVLKILSEHGSANETYSLNINFRSLINKK